jgi:capsular exopolysaccharide synthesis family protein
VDSNNELPESVDLANEIGARMPAAHLFDRLAVVYRYRWSAIALFAIVVLIKMTDSFMTAPQYKASARLLIAEERSATSDFKSDEMYVDPEPYYETQYRILRGRDLARRVVRRLRLDAVAEFNGTAPAPMSIATFAKELPRRAMAMYRQLAFGETPQPKSAPQPITDEEVLASAFLGRVDVRPVGNSLLVDVFVQAADPWLAARAADALVEEYVQQNLEFRLQATERSLGWVSDEVSRQQQKVEASERALADYREQQNALSLEGRQNIVVARLNQLNDALTRAKTARMQKQALYNEVRSAGPDDAFSVPVVAQSPYIQTLRGRVADLQREQLRLSARYGDRHPEVLKVNATIQDSLRQLEEEVAKAVDAVRSDYEVALSEEMTLAGALEDQKQAAMELDRKSVSYTVLEREAQSNRQVYEALLQREKELRVVSNSRGNNVRLLDRAQKPGAPFTPQRHRDWAIAIALGLVAAAGLVWTLNYLNDTIRTPEDIIRGLHIPFLGYLPAVKRHHPSFVDAAPDQFTEALRMLRTSTIGTFRGARPKIIAITSSQPLEGKTTTSCNLARALAHGGARVLLIDADMRRPSLHRVLGASNERGLSSLLSGSAVLKDVAQSTDTANLVLISSGPIPPNPAELLASPRMRTLLTSVRDVAFDWIIIDTPPVLAVTDSVVVASMVEGMLLVIGSEMTRRTHAARALEVLRGSCSGPIAAALNKVNLTRNKYYYAHHYGYDSSPYYAEAS